MRNKKNLSGLSGEQQGFVSLVVALTMIIILALLTLGFAQLARHEQQQALDRQLSIQANYAAETGLNDAYKEIMAGHITSSVNTPSPNNCTDLHNLPTSPTFNYSPVINAAGDVRYTCVLINLTPLNLNWTNVGAGSDRTITFTTSSSPSRMVISWGSNTGRTTFPNDTSGKFPPSWPYPAVIQLSVTPYPPGAVDRDSLIANSFTTYLYPAKTGSFTTGYTTGIGKTAGNGPIVSGDCNLDTGNTDPNRGSTYPCSVTITGLDNVGGGPNTYSGPYLVHFLNLYDASNINLKYYDQFNTPGKFIDGQAVIDATGKARDVLKRLQVHAQLTGTDGFVHSSGLELPNFALEGQNVCKRLLTDPTQPTDFKNMTGGNAVAGDPCYQTHP